MSGASGDDSTIEEITQNYLAQCQAMVDADVSELGRLLMPDFTLTHMTGYAQSRQDWLDDAPRPLDPHLPRRHRPRCPETSSA